MALGVNPPNFNLPTVLQNRNVQIGVVVGVVLIIASVILFIVYNANTSLGNLKLLVKGIDQSRALEIAADLKTLGIDAELVQAETGGVSIEVRDKQYDTAILQLARSDLLSQDDFKLFDKTDYAASDYEKRIKYMRAIGGELSRLISRMEGVKWGKVHVTIPQQKLFNSRNSHDDASASVTIQTDAGYILNGSQVASILSLVSGYVPELIPAHISITDTKGRVYSSAAQPDAMSPGGGALLGQSVLGSQTENLNNQIAGRVQGYLDSVVGSGNSTVAVSLRLISARMSRQSTAFYPGAIANHEYSEEALGDAASTEPFRGQGALPPLPIPKESSEESFSQSQGSELVDPRLTKDLPPPPEGSMAPSSAEEGSDHRQDELEGSYYEKGAPEKMADQIERMKIKKMQEMSQAPQSSQQKYVCASNDTACQRNYRQHNFSIQNYPSYEQTSIDSPPGDIRNIKISVVMARGTLPTSITRLKKAIAAAADPNMSPDNVEIILRRIEEPPPKDNLSQLFNFEKSPWLGVALVVIGIIVLLFIVSQVFQAAANFGRNLRQRPSEANINPYEAQAASSGPPRNDAMDRLDNFARRGPPPPPPQQTTSPPLDQPVQPIEPLASGFSSDDFEDLPFELDDEFSNANLTPSYGQNSSPGRLRNQPPPPARAKIFFDEDE